ncbi:MAG: hypothetical protein JJU29_08870 [Verrucomicrobia bacterium]|nr:hypothetical protein [Verrucomicrobiota bacterium]MCH8511382.1 hypothetical protein [Kiritimatiellia bacterium]
MTIGKTIGLVLCILLALYTGNKLRKMFAIRGWVPGAKVEMKVIQLDLLKMKSITHVFFAFFISGCGEFSNVGGIGSDYPAKDHDPKLTEIAEKAGPIFDAIEAYAEEHANHPPSLGNIQDALPADGIEKTPNGGVHGFRGWMYFWEPDGYRLVYRLGWDPHLVYDSRDDTWTFEPGDGSPETTIVLEPRKRGSLKDED